jgi:hypothetical protein
MSVGTVVDIVREPLLERIAYLEGLLSRVEKLANAPLSGGRTSHMQRLISIRIELGSHQPGVDALPKSTS